MSHDEALTTLSGLQADWTARFITTISITPFTIQPTVLTFLKGLSRTLKFNTGGCFSELYSKATTLICKALSAPFKYNIQHFLLQAIKLCRHRRLIRNKGCHDWFSIVTRLGTKLFMKEPESYSQHFTGSTVRLLHLSRTRRSDYMSVPYPNSMINWLKE